jgi:hypothetical protein
MLLITICGSFHNARLGPLLQLGPVMLAIVGRNGVGVVVPFLYEYLSTILVLIDKVSWKNCCHCYG